MDWDLERLERARTALHRRGNLDAFSRQTLRELMDPLVAAYPKRGVVATTEYTADELIMTYADLFVRERMRAERLRAGLAWVGLCAQAWHLEGKGNDHLARLAEEAGIVIQRDD